MLRICAPLAFLHGEGIVHRDLKPSNIIIQPGEIPVIMDFGLMIEFWGTVSRDDLEGSQTSGGTMLYIPPEQIIGDIVDARADLYSLGCIFYEIVTGQVPFIAHSILQATQAHMNLQPCRPSLLVDGVPEELDELILKLLSKKPGDRIGHAGGIAAILKQLGAEDYPGLAAYKPKSYLYRPGFAGRDSLMKSVLNETGRLDDNTGGVVMLAGESGLGKTRFLMELARFADRRQIMIFSGECPPPFTEGTEAVAVTPLSALNKIFNVIRDKCVKGGEDTTKKLLGNHCRILDQFFPQISSAPGYSKYPSMPELQADSARLRLFSSLTQTLKNLALEAPLMILIDDLQWSDEILTGFLEFSLRTGFFASAPVLFVAAYRPEEMNTAIRRILNIPQVVKFELQRLTTDAINRIISDMLAIQDPSSVFVDFLNRFSEGNPFFVSEYLRVCLEEQLLYRDASGGWQITPEGENKVTEAEMALLPLPHSLKSLVEHRLKILSDSARQVVDIASVIGQEFDTMILWSLTSFSPDVLDAIDELLNRQILEEVRPGILKFLHDGIKKVAYNQIPSELLPQMHRKVAESYEAMLTGTADEFYPVIGHHWELAGDTVKARQYYLKAADSFAGKYALEDAEKMYRANLRLRTGITEESISTRLRLASKVMGLRGQQDEALAESEIALQESRSIQNRKLEAESLMGIAYYYATRGHHEQAKKLGEAARQICMEMDNKEGLANGAAFLGSVFIREGAMDKAQDYYEEGLALYRDLGIRSGEAGLLAKLATLSFKQSRFDEAFDLYESARVIHHDMGIRHLEAETIRNQAMVFWSLGNLDAASKLCRKAIDMFKEAGDRRHESSTLTNLAIIKHYQQDLAAADAVYEEAISVQRQVGDRFVIALTLNNHGYLLFEMGQVERAEAMFREALVINRELGAKPNLARNLIGLAALTRQAFGDFAESETMINEAMEHLLNTKEYSLRVRALCELGHTQLAKLSDAAGTFEEIQTLIETHRLQEDRSMLDVFNKLKKAYRAFCDHQPLIRGDLPGEYPEGLKRWLANRK